MVEKIPQVQEDPPILSLEDIKQLVEQDDDRQGQEGEKKERQGEKIKSQEGIAKIWQDVGKDEWLYYVKLQQETADISGAIDRMNASVVEETTGKNDLKASIAEQEELYKNLAKERADTENKIQEIEGILQEKPHLREQVQPTFDSFKTAFDHIVSKEADAKRQSKELQMRLAAGIKKERDYEELLRQRDEVQTQRNNLMGAEEMPEDVRSADQEQRRRVLYEMSVNYEKELRTGEEILTEALSKKFSEENSSPERDVFLPKLVASFLREELAHERFFDDTSYDHGMGEMKNWLYAMVKQVDFGSSIKVLRDSRVSERFDGHGGKFAGQLLSKLSGAKDNYLDTLHYLVNQFNQEEGYGKPAKQYIESNVGVVNKAFERHLGTINLIRAREDKIPEKFHKAAGVLETSKEFSEYFDGMNGVSFFSQSTTGPILPIDGMTGEREFLEAQYKIYRQDAEKEAEALNTREQENERRGREEKEQKEQKKKDKLKKLQNAEHTEKYLQEQALQKQRYFEDIIRQEEHSRKNLREAQEKLENMRWYMFGKPKIRKDIQEMKKNIALLKKERIVADREVTDITNELEEAKHAVQQMSMSRD